MTTQRGTLSLSDALTMFLLDCEARRLTPATRQFYRLKLSVFMQWCTENTIEALPELTAHDIRRFLVNGERRGLSSQYQHNLARSIRAFLNYCVRDELISESPFRKVQMPRLEKKIPRAFTANEVKSVLKACAIDRDKAICLFLLDSGLRLSELIALDVGDVDMSTGTVLVRAGKGQKERMTCIGAKTRKQVVRYLVSRNGVTPDEPLFVSEKSGNRLTVSGLVQLMKRLRGRSQVDNCTCHTFRRTFALTCLRNGMNIYALARLMGHADIVILRQYLALVEDDIMEAHLRYGVVDNMGR